MHSAVPVAGPLSPATSSPGTRAADRRGERAVAVLLVALHLLVAGLAVAAPTPGQSATSIPRVGFIGERSADDPWLESFRQGLRELGHVEGRTIVVEYRFANGVTEAFPSLAAELVRAKVEVMVVGGGVAARAAKAASATIPIVFMHVGDPVGAGLVASLGRPGGSVTGLSNAIIDLGGKQLELLKAAVPKGSRIGVLHNPLNSGAALAVLGDAARTLKLDLELQGLRRPSELSAAFASLVGRKVDAVMALSDPVFGVQLQRLAELSSRHGLPSLYARREFAHQGGLLAYGPDFADNYRRAATYVDKILRGARPGDLAVERPTRFELVVNLKTARALGLDLDPLLLQRADFLID